MAVPAIAVALAVSGCSSGASSSSQPSGAASPSAPAATATVSAAASGAGAGATTATCVYTRTGGGSASLPPSTTDPAIAYTATLRTSQGNIGITLDDAKAPCTVNSFVHLAETGFWAGTECHRLSTDGGLFILQCGDPTATANKPLTCDGTAGSGGPGYSFNDENLTGASYGAGTLAMANAGPNTNGSQFFLVYKASQLPPSYTPFGAISASGLAVISKIASAGTSCVFPGAGGGVPKDKVVISAVSIAKG
jgi:peptidyl-prolyl cis-trans isomerase B (cyclophilin B)